MTEIIVIYKLPLPAPYYQFGSLYETGRTPGPFAFIEGESVASGGYAHSEGFHTIAVGGGSHAEGNLSQSMNRNAHAEGNGTLASGENSHAQNLSTIASSDEQTALGKYNISDSADTYAVIVGNGASTNARSNALTVDWDGNVELALDTTAASGTEDGDLYAAITALVWEGTVID